MRQKKTNLPIEELAAKHGMNPRTLSARLSRGWSLQEALERPVRQKLPPRKYKVIYPNIYKWIEDHGMTYLDFAAYCDLADNAVGHLLYGFTDPKKITIDKILDATGMTYEEAFKTE